MPPKTTDSEEYAAAQAAKDTIEKALAEHDEEAVDIATLEAAIKEAGAAVAGMIEYRKRRANKPDPIEDELTKQMDAAQEAVTALQAAAKAAKDAAKRALAAVVSTATPFTGDKPALHKAIQDGEECGVPDRELSDARDKLNAITSFQFHIKDGTETIAKASKGKAAIISIKKLEDAINGVKEEGGCYNNLQKIELEQWMLALTKPAATAIATDAMDEAVAKAQELGMTDTIWKPLRKKNEDAKKAQNAKKIADRKAKKPPSDPPKPPDRPLPHADVLALKEDLESTLAAAEVLLVEAKATLAMKAASKPSLLETQLLLDLGDRTCEELHPTLQTLSDAVDAAKAANVDPELLSKAEDTLADAKKRRLEVRTDLAKTKVMEASAAAVDVCDVKVLGEMIKVAEEESVPYEIVAEMKAHEYMSYKTQSENILEPLAHPQAITHEGFQIIDPLKAALDEAKKRGAQEDLRIKAEVKLDYWLEARTRRDNAIKAMNLSLKPPPCSVEQPKVEECIEESKEARVDPVLVAEAEKKLMIAHLAQRMYSKSELAPGKLNIPELIAELADVGGEEQGIQQQRQTDLEERVAFLQGKIEAIKDTKASQKARDDLLKKQVKLKPHGQKPEDKSKTEELLPAWVRKEDVVEHEIEHEVADPVAVQQEKDLKAFEEELNVTQVALKEQIAVVKAIVGDVYVPQDAIAFAQKKLSVAQLADAMQDAMRPELLDLDCAALQASIVKCEQKYEDMTIAGLGELELSVPKEEITAAQARLKLAQKAQARQKAARTQLQVRVNAPTGTATFDMLVKLVAEAKAAGVEDDLVLRAELKLKKMEELAASSLRAGPLAFVSFHFPCLKACVSSYAVSLVERAEVKRNELLTAQEAAKAELMKQIGTWEYGIFDKTLLAPVTDEEALKAALHVAASAGLPQDVLELGRLKVQMVDKYKRDRARGLVKDEEEEARKAAEAAAAAAKSGKGGPKKKMKQYAYIKKG